MCALAVAVHNLCITYTVAFFLLFFLNNCRKADELILRDREKCLKQCALPYIVLCNTKAIPGRIFFFLSLDIYAVHCSVNKKGTLYGGVAVKFSSTFSFFFLIFLQSYKSPVKSYGYQWFYFLD